MPATCYACFREQTSVEHVPPRNFFPKKGDVDDGRNYRIDLITVPSCDEHNSEKSRDDEFLRMVFCSALGANSVAQLLATKPVARSIQRRPALASSMFMDARDVDVVDSATGQVHEAALAPLDRPRFNRALELMARGLFRHHFEAPWLDTVRVHYELGATDDPEIERHQQPLRMELRDRTNRVFAGAPRHGANPDVFFYQVREDGDGFAFRMTFYGGVRVIASLPRDWCGGSFQFPA